MPFKDKITPLQDMLENIALIESTVSGMSFEQYRADRVRSAAVERFFQIVTEAAYRLGEEADAVCPGPPWREWRDFGNILRRAYQRVEAETVWETIFIDMPELKAAVVAALARQTEAG